MIKHKEPIDVWAENTFYTKSVYFDILKNIVALKFFPIRISDLNETRRK